MHLDDMGIKDIDVFGDSLLVVQQVRGEFQCLDGMLRNYLDRCLDIVKKMDTFTIVHISRDKNGRANFLAQQASGYNIERGQFFIEKEPMFAGSNSIERSNSGHKKFEAEQQDGMDNADWRKPLVECLQNPSNTKDRNVRRQVLKYTLMEGELYRRTIDGLLLKCLDEEESKVAMGEVHEGMCGTHQSAHKMRWMLKRAGFYWPTMMEDCFRYFKGCEACQRFGDIQSAPASTLHPIIKPWPFRGWGLDFIGEIHPCSYRRHRFVLVATDYFTKWTEAVPLKNMTHKELISFVLEHIVYRFGIPQTLTTDQGAAFMSHQFKDFAKSLRIKLLNSSPYYAQANGQAESSNKVLIRLIKKKIAEQPKRWHEVLSEALWAHRVSRHGATKVTPFELVYGQEAVLPIEVNLQACRVACQNSLSAKVYGELMLDRIDGNNDSRLTALREIEKEKLRVARAYNKKVKEKSFQIGELVWKTILPVGVKNNKFGKWSPNWEGPFKVVGIVHENAYFVEDLQGRRLPKALNGKYLKKYYPSIWQGVC
jgi:hypothetical protein